MIMTLDKMQREALYPPRYMGLGCIKLNLKNGELLNFYHMDRGPPFAEFIHNHQFTFDSEVLKGTLRNIMYRIDEVEEDMNQKMVFGACTKGIEWEVIKPNVNAVETRVFDTAVGGTYHMPVEDFHHVERLDDKVITRVHNIVWHRQEAYFIHPKDEPVLCAFSRPKDVNECWEIIEDTMT